VEVIVVVEVIMVVVVMVVVVIVEGQLVKEIARRRFSDWVVAAGRPKELSESFHLQREKRDEEEYMSAL